MGIQALHSRSLLLSFFLGVVFLHPPGAYPSNLQAYHTVVGAAGLVPEDLQALSLASGDLDGDGIADLAAGFADGLGRGRVGFFRLPSERIYPDSGKKEKIAQESNWPFEEPVWLDLPAAPDWLELIDVDRDGRRDLVAATRGEPRLFWLKRKGAMEFESPRDVALSGDPVLMRVLDVPRSDGWPDLVVGLEGSEGPSLLLFTHPHQLFQDPEVVQLDELPVDVARMRLGAEHRPTLVVASGQKVLLLSELTRRLKENPVEATVFALTTTPIRSLVAGQFDVEKPGEELAVLGEEGDIQFLAGTGLPCSKEAELSLGAHSAVLVESRVAAGVATPLVVLDKAWGTARVLTGEGEEQRLEWLAAGLGSTVAVEAMRLNPDGLDDLVILSKGPRPLQVVETQGSGAFVVNLESDERDFSLAKDAMGVFHCDIDNDPANGDNCTLTAALQQANADPDPNTIVFAVDQVVMEKALPRIRDTVTIDGMEPKEGRSEVRVEIDAGSKATEIFNFDAGSEGSVIRGMVLRTNFGGVIKAAADEITIEGNYVATDRSGMNPMSLGLNHGVLLRGSNSTVGGLVTAARNVPGNGVRVDGGTGNTVLNNYIGTAADGLKALGSGVCGVTILGAGNEGVDDEIPKTTDNTIGSLASNKEGILGNLISGNFCGVEVRNAPGNRILGNWIGSDKSGQRRLTGLDSFPVMGNLFNGVEVVASNRTEITGNVIVASGRNGVRLGVTSTSNVNDNIVGVNAAGTFSDPDGEPDSGDELGNRWSGIAVDGNDDPEGTGVNLAGNRIQENLFGGNLLNGISLNGQNNTVFGNRVGVSKQALELGNGLAGAVVFGSDNRIGGEGNGEPNTIAHNQGDGVTIRVGAINNSIIANSIFENGGIGIDLETARDGVTENDPDDSDEGPNQLQNFPFVIAADADSIRGNLPGSSGRIFRLEFFSNESCDESGHGEGATLIGFILCAAGTDAQCLTVDGDLTFETPFGAPAGKQITATATEFVGGLPGNTSEFSKCVGTQAGRVFMVNSDGDETDSDLTAVPARPFDGLCDTGKRFPDGSLECTLRAAIAEANSDKIEDTIQFAVKDLEIKLERPLQVTFPAIIDGAGQNVTISPIFPELDIHALMISAGDSTVRGLTIKGFPDGWAITLEKADGNTIQGNTLIENLAGITIRSDSNDNQIGGVWEGDVCLDPCNLISANSGPGIAIFTDLNRVQGNFIGVDRTGTRRRGNDGFGVWISSNEEGKGSTNEIGGTRRGQGNLISANGWGIQISDQDPSATPVGDNVIQGNRIGTDRSGLQNLGNARCGICIGLQVEGRNQIGEKLEALADDVSLEPPAANLIAFNDVGVEIEGPGGGTVLSNSIFSNRFSNLMYCQERKTERCPPLDKFFPRPPEPVLFGATVHCDQVCKEDPNVQGGIRVTFKLDTTRPLGEDPGGRRFTFQTFFNDECRVLGEDGLLLPPGGKHLIDTRARTVFPNQKGRAEEVRVFANLSIPVGPDGRPPLSGITMTATSQADGTSEFSNCVLLKEDSDGDGCADTDEKQGEENDAKKCKTPTGLEIEADDATAEAISVSTFPGSLPEQNAIFPTGFLDLGIILPGINGSSTLGVEPGPQATTVTLFLPPDVKVDSYFNFGPTPDDPEPHYYEFLFDGVTGTEIFEDRIVLHFVDGARGDHDLTVNGEIVTRGGPVTNASLLLFPFNRTVAGSFTGFAVSNFSERNAVVEFDAFDSQGDLSLFRNNPAVFAVSESAQVARLGGQIFEADESTDAVSWVRAKTDNPELGSFFQIGGGARLDGSVAFTEQSKLMYFTRVFEGVTSFRGQPASTLLSIANPNSEEITVRLTLLGNPEGGSPADWIQPSGSLSPDQIRVIAPRGALFGTVSEIFQEELNVSSAFIQVEVTEGEGAVGFELIGLQNQDTVIGLNASFGSEQTESFSAQLASVAASVFTNLKVLNTSEGNRSLTLTAVAEDGSDLAAPVQMNLGPEEFLEQDAGEVFDFDGNAVGSLRIQADGEGVIGDIIFGDPVGMNFAASLPLQTETFTEAVFSQVADLPGLFFTGLAFYNPGNVDAEITIEIISANGELVGQAVRVLEAGKRLSELTSQLVPESAGQAGGYVLIRSDQPLIAQIIFGGLGSRGITLFSAVPPTVIQ